jgi:cyanophycinase
VIERPPWAERSLTLRYGRSILPVAVALCLASVWPAHAATSKGHLMIIGGGDRTEDVMARFVQLAGGARARVAVIPNASSVPDEVGPEQVAELLAAGAGQAFELNLDRQAPNAETTLQVFDGVTGVFFSGGDQSRLTAVLAGTQLLERIRHLYAAGGVIGGTSAGAAVMSRVMITGDERRNPSEEDAFTVILKDNVVTTEGFGFLEGVIVDQHFLARKRHNRLISLMLEHPDLLGVGIDEDTAILVFPDRTFEVLGGRQVLVIDATVARNVSSDSGGRLSGEGIVVHLLRPGQRFDLAARRPIS